MLINFPDKFSYSGYGIEYESCSLFPLPNFDWGKNDMSFGEDNGSSVYVISKKKYTLVRWNVPLTFQYQ